MSRLPGVSPIMSGRRVNDGASPSVSGAGVAMIFSRAGAWISGSGSSVFKAGPGCGFAA